MDQITKLLVVDDDPAICTVLKDYLEVQGYDVLVANDGAQMRKIMESSSVDLVILDLIMPGEDGLSLTRYLRESSDVAIIILTGKDDEVDRIVGLEMGADDYVAKPFNLRELLARVKTVLRRSQSQVGEPTTGPSSLTKFAGWSFDKIGRRLLSPSGEEVNLTTMEFNLLIAFTDNANKVLDRDTLLDILQNRSWEPEDRSIDVLVGRLRSKIEKDPKKPEFIKTVRGTDYVFATTVEHV